MNSKQAERASYIAAHRILTTNLNAPELACPGARRSHTVDAIARIIADTYSAHSIDTDDQTTFSEVADAAELREMGMRR